MSTIAEVSKKRAGRVRTANSERMSEAMFKAKNVQGLTLQAIADKYNKDKRRQEAGKTLTAQAVYARIKDFAARNPEKVSEILGSVEPENIVSAEATDALAIA